MKGNRGVPERLGGKMVSCTCLFKICNKK